MSVITKIAELFRVRPDGDDGEWGVYASTGGGAWSIGRLFSSESLANAAAIELNKLTALDTVAREHGLIAVSVRATEIRQGDLFWNPWWHEIVVATTDAKRDDGREREGDHPVALMEGIPTPKRDGTTELEWHRLDWQVSISVQSRSGGGGGCTFMDRDRVTVLRRPPEPARLTVDEHGSLVCSEHGNTVVVDRDVEPTESGSYWYACSRRDCRAAGWSGI